MPDQDEAEPGVVLRQVLLPGGMGGNVTVKKGDTIGGDFQHVPLCTAQGQHGCVVAYSTFARPPGLVYFFGRTDPDLASLVFGFEGGRGFEIACTDPAVLSGDSGEFGITVPSEPFAAAPSPSPSP